MEPMDKWELMHYESLRRVPIHGWQNVVNALANSNGFWESPNVDQKLMLVVGELSEAHEELRKGKRPTEIYYTETAAGRKPEGFGPELADAMIRILDLAQFLGIDLGAVMAEKHLYNEKRPYKHGKQF